MFTYNLESGGYYTFRYTTSDFVFNTTLVLELNDISSTSTLAKVPYLYYKVCTSSNVNDCYMT